MANYKDRDRDRLDRLFLLAPSTTKNIRMAQILSGS